MASQQPSKPYNPNVPTLQLGALQGVIDSRASWGDTVAIMLCFQVVNLDHHTCLSTGLKVYTTLSTQVFLSINYGPTHNESGDIVVRARCNLGGSVTIIRLIPEFAVDMTISEYRDIAVVGEYHTVFTRTPSDLYNSLPQDYAGGVVWGKLAQGVNLGMLKVKIRAAPRLRMLGPFHSFASHLNKWPLSNEVEGDIVPVEQGNIMMIQVGKKDKCEKKENKRDRDFRAVKRCKNNVPASRYFLRF
ncbi:hypothetical protein B0H16DRAFT_1796876 [Mycena metata]|uniref:Uncharacterized protein n=1 Tax=Mycena metata TaxID=1033252 RepID=A0AAD7HED4_9AGAR|nr:hypothetical protein B0H16DRAFT_1796876 [Mycena metata]